MGDRFPLLSSAPCAPLLENHGRHVGLRRGVDLCDAQYCKDFERTADEGGAGRLHLPAHDGPSAGHPLPCGARQPRETRGADRLGVPSFGRRHDLRIPRAVELHGRHVAAQGRRDPDGGERRAGACRRVHGAGRRGGRGIAAIRCRGASGVREDLRLRGGRIRRLLSDGRRQCAVAAGNALPGRRGAHGSHL